MAPAVVPRQRGRTRSPARTIHCSYAWNFAPYYLYLPSFSYFMLFFFLYSFIFFDAPYVRSRATHAHTTYIYMYISIYRYIIITWLYPLSRLIHLFENSFWSSVEKETDGARRRLACLSLFYYFFFFTLLLKYDINNQQSMVIAIAIVTVIVVERKKGSFSFDISPIVNYCPSQKFIFNSRVRPDSAVTYIFLTSPCFSSHSLSPSLVLALFLLLLLLRIKSVLILIHFCPKRERDIIIFFFIFFFAFCFGRHAICDHRFEVRFLSHTLSLSHARSLARSPSFSLSHSHALTLAFVLTFDFDLRQKVFFEFREKFYPLRVSSMHNDRMQ